MYINLPPPTSGYYDWQDNARNSRHQWYRYGSTIQQRLSAKVSYFQALWTCLIMSSPCDIYCPSSGHWHRWDELIHMYTRFRRALSNVSKISPVTDAVLPELMAYTSCPTSRPLYHFGLPITTIQTNRHVTPHTVILAGCVLRSWLAQFVIH